MLIKSILMLSPSFLARLSGHCYDSLARMLTLAVSIAAWSFRFERVRVSLLMAESRRSCTLKSQHRE